MMYEIPLTSEQKIFATQNHDLVYKFLNENRLPIDEFYDVVIFGYLRAVKRFFNEKGLHCYQFATIAWNCMKVDLINHSKVQSRQKNSAETISLHAEIDDNLSLEEAIIVSDSIMQQLEVELLLHDLAKHVSKQQMEIVRLKSSGYNLRDIATRQNTSTKRIRSLLEEVRCVLTELCRE